MLKSISRALSSLLVAASLVMVPVVANASVTPGNASCELAGSGTAGDRYLVDSRAALEEVADCANATTMTYFKQTDMIDLNSGVWNPLVDEDPATSSGLKIDYDGDNWAITRMKAEGLWMASLFGHLGAGSSVTNLLLHGQSVGYVKTVPSSGPYVPAKHLAGAVAALSTGGVTIQNIQVAGFSRISGATAGSLVGVLAGGTSTISDNFFDSIWHGLGIWSLQRGGVSAMSSFHGGTPPTSAADISAAGGLVGAVVGASSDVTMNSNFVSSWIAAGGIDAVDRDTARQSPVRIGGLVGYLEAGKLSISGASITGNFNGSEVLPTSAFADEFATAGVVGFVSHANLAPISLQISDVRSSIQYRGWAHLAGVVGNYRTDLSNQKTIQISNVLATGATASSQDFSGRVVTGVRRNTAANSATDVRISESVVLMSENKANNSGVVVAAGVPQSSIATITNLYIDPSLSDSNSAAAFTADAARALPSDWTTKTAPKPFSADTDSIELSSVDVMSTWTNETFATCSGADVAAPGFQIGVVTFLADYAITMPALESGVCAADGFSISYPVSSVGVSPTSSVRESVSSGVLSPTTGGKGLIYRAATGSTLPAGIVLNPGTGALVGKPTAALTQDVTVRIEAMSGDQISLNPRPANRLSTTDITFTAANSSPPEPAVVPVLNVLSAGDHVTLDHGSNQVINRVRRDANQEFFDITPDYSLTQLAFFACTNRVPEAAVFEMATVSMSGPNVRDLTIGSTGNSCKAFTAPADFVWLADIDLATMVSGEAFTSLLGNPSYKHLTFGKVVDSNSNAAFQSADHVVLARSTEYRPVSNTDAPLDITQPTVSFNGTAVVTLPFATEYSVTDTLLWLCEEPVTKVEALTASSAEILPAHCDPASGTPFSHGRYTTPQLRTLLLSSLYTQVDSTGDFVLFDFSNPDHNKHVVAAAYVLAGAAPSVFYRVHSDSALLTNSGSSSGSSSQDAGVTAAPYLGPVVLAISNSTVNPCAPQNLTITGEKLAGTSFKLQGKELTVLEASDTKVVLELPAGLVGEQDADLEITSSFGTLIQQDSIDIEQAVCSERASSGNWTKLSSDGKSVKLYSKDPIGQGKIQFFVDGKEIAWVRAVDQSDPKLSFAKGFSYLVRTVDLAAGKNRFEILVDGERVFRATYVPKD